MVVGVCDHMCCIAEQVPAGQLLQLLVALRAGVAQRLLPALLGLPLLLSVALLPDWPPALRDGNFLPLMLMVPSH